MGSIKTGFWDLSSLEDSSGSVRRKRVPQVRAREDNQCGYRGSPGLVKMVLIRVLTRDLVCLAFADLQISGKSVDRFVKPVDRFVAL